MLDRRRESGRKHGLHWLLHVQRRWYIQPWKGISLSSHGCRRLEKAKVGMAALSVGVCRGRRRRGGGYMGPAAQNKAATANKGSQTTATSSQQVGGLSEQLFGNYHRKRCHVPSAFICLLKANNLILLYVVSRRIKKVCSP